MMKQKFFVFFSFLVISMMMGNDAVHANLDITQRKISDVKRIEEKERLEADDSPKEKESHLNVGLLFDMEFGDMTYTIQGPEEGAGKANWNGRSTT